MIRVGVNGYGTIGKRVARAVSLQPDMRLVGVAKTKADYRAGEARQLGFKVFAAKEKFPGAEGTLDDLLRECDVIVDCAPDKLGAANRPLYEKAGVRAVFQGGEKAEVAEASFNALTNFDAARGKNFVRVVSCNTTGLARTVGTLNNSFALGKVRVVLVRRAADPAQSDKGPINAIVPVAKVPSHQGPDLQTVLPGLKITTLAVAVPTTLMHVHCVSAEINAAAEKVLEAFRANPRIRLFNFADGFASTADIMEHARFLGRDMGDLYEAAVWGDAVAVKDGELFYFQAVHQESIVVPENIDCIRAMLSAAAREESMRLTDKSLGIGAARERAEARA
jgi:glyceraldehyde-3-phosphate dehydrogenase (NAD(P))